MIDSLWFTIHINSYVDDICEKNHIEIMEYYDYYIDECIDINVIYNIEKETFCVTYQKGETKDALLHMKKNKKIRRFFIKTEKNLIIDYIIELYSKIGKKKYIHTYVSLTNWNTIYNNKTYAIEEVVLNNPIDKIKIDKFISDNLLEKKIMSVSIFTEKYHKAICADL